MLSRSSLQMGETMAKKGKDLKVTQGLAFCLQMIPIAIAAVKEFAAIHGRIYTDADFGLAAWWGRPDFDGAPDGELRNFSCVLGYAGSDGDRYHIFFEARVYIERSAWDMATIKMQRYSYGGHHGMLDKNTCSTRHSVVARLEKNGWTISAEHVSAELYCMACKNIRKKKCEPCGGSGLEKHSRGGTFDRCNHCSSNGYTDEACPVCKDHVASEPTAA